MKKTVEDGVQWYRRGDVNVARLHEGELAIFPDARPDEVAVLAKGASKVKRLVLRGQHLGPARKEPLAFIAAVVAAPWKPSAIEFNSLQPADEPPLAAWLAKLRGLEALEVHRPLTLPVSFTWLPTLGALESLKLVGKKLSLEGLAEFAPALKRLELSCERLDLAPLTSLKHLRSLTVTGTWALAGLPMLAKLEHLSLQPGLEPEAAKTLAKLASIRRLGVTWTERNAATVERAVGALAGLEELRLEGLFGKKKIKDVEFLARLTRLQSLVTPFLVLPSLAPLAAMKGLRKVGSTVSDGSGIEAVLSKLPPLTESFLEVQKNKPTAEVLAKLRRVQPGLEIS